MITLTSKVVSISIDPNEGGRWCSLRDLRSDHEWFWSNPYLPSSPVKYGDSFIEQHDTGGWHEIFPSVSPCQLDDFGAIPDHGDLVQLPWQVDSYESNRLSMSVSGRCLPFRFERELVVDGCKIHCEYRVRNIGKKSFPWLWCAHPLLCTADVEVETGTSFTVAAALGAAESLLDNTITLEQLPGPEAEPWAVKLFSERSSVSSVTIRQSDSNALRMDWDSEAVPYLGLWLNNGAWSGCGSKPYYNMGIEPGMVPVDDLSVAKKAPILKPGETHQWALTVSIN